MNYDSDYPNLVIEDQRITHIDICGTRHAIGGLPPFVVTAAILLQIFAERAAQYHASGLMLDCVGAEINWRYRKASLLRLKDAEQACIEHDRFVCNLTFVSILMLKIVDEDRKLEDSLMFCAYEWSAFDEAGCEPAVILARPAFYLRPGLDVPGQVDTLLRYAGTPHRGERAAWLICDHLADSKYIKPSLIKTALQKLSRCWVTLLSRDFLSRFLVTSAAEPININLSRALWIWEIGCRAAPYLYDGEGPDERSGLGLLRTRMRTGLEYISRHAPHLLEHVTHHEHKFPDLRIIMAYNPITGMDNSTSSTAKGRVMSDRKRGVLEKLTDQSDSTETATSIIPDPDPDPTTPKEAPVADTVKSGVATAGEPVTIIEALVLRPEDSYFTAVWYAVKLGGSTAISAKISDGMTNLLMERLPRALPVLSIPLAIPGMSRLVSLIAPPAIGWMAHRRLIPKMMLSHEKQATLAKWCVLATTGQTTRFLYDLGDDLMGKIWRNIRDILEEEDPELLKNTQIGQS